MPKRITDEEMRHGFLARRSFGSRAIKSLEARLTARLRRSKRFSADYSKRVFSGKVARVGNTPNTMQKTVTYDGLF